MKQIKWTCDWCQHVEHTEQDLPTGWIERNGKLPVMYRDAAADKKYRIVVPSKAMFCADLCNQRHKNAEALADVAARQAWVQEYDKHK